MDWSDGEVLKIGAFTEKFSREMKKDLIFETRCQESEASKVNNGGRAAKTHPPLMKGSIRRQKIEGFAEIFSKRKETVLIFGSKERTRNQDHEMKL